MGDLREQRPRHPEDHRDQIDDERHQHDGVAGQITEALEDGPNSPT
jgi:hypothetical protein